MKHVKIKFIDFSPGFDIRQSLIYEVIARNFDIDLSETPDYVVCGGLGAEHMRYNDQIKILRSGENVVPDFNSFDYATGFDHLIFGDRYLRMPLYAYWHKEFRGVRLHRESMQIEKLLDRKFCSFVVSNMSNSDPMRRYFFERLSKYKRVDSGGRELNNVGAPVADKIKFCHGYKFNIAFENSSYSGYVTEKIMEAYLAQTVPIYYGDPTIETDFRLESMIRVRGMDDVERAIEEIIWLDNDDEAYAKRLKECCLSYEDPRMYERQLEKFLCHIFEQPLAMAYRRCFYGCQKVQRAQAKSAEKCGLRMLCRLAHLR